MKYQTLATSLPAELAQLVRQEAAESDRPISRVMAEALRVWAEQKKAHSNG